jgi:nitroreductase
MTDPFLDLLRQRRSIRIFDTRPVEDEKRDKLLEAALRAPSSRGRNPWEFVVVDERELLQQLAKAKLHGSAFLASAPLAIAVVADPARCDVWIEDVSIAAILIHLAAASLGLGSCWTQIRERQHDSAGRSANDYLVELLKLPAGYRVGPIIGIGYPGEFKAGHARDELEWAKLHANQFGSSLQPDRN